MRVLPLLLLLPLASSAGSAAETAIRPQRTIRLFDGKSLAPFYPWLVDDHREDRLRVFTVVDQVDGAPAIRISGERWGGLVTRESYRDYRLVVEFRWGLATWGERRSGGRDSGILVHGQGADGNTGADGNGRLDALDRGPGHRGRRRRHHPGRRLRGSGPPASRRTSPSRASTDRDGEAVFDPKGQPRELESGRINWSGRDVDWQDRLGFRGARTWRARTASGRASR